MHFLTNFCVDSESVVKTWCLKTYFCNKNARQAPAGTAESKKKDPEQKKKSFDHQGKATFCDLISKYRYFDDLGKAFFAFYFPNVNLLIIKGKQDFAFYFPNVDFLMIKGKQIVAIFQVLVTILGF